ncbi:MAG TPA: ABC transporter permease [Gaiellaceae bacterium]|nr:ABC transporter permease [Gaiellaceae bacterium]
MSTVTDWSSAVAVAQEAPGRRGRMLRQLRRDPVAVAAAAILAVFVLVTALGPVIAPYPAQGRGTADVAARDLAPSGAHLFGTDHLGRDVVSRVIMGTRPALGSAAAVVLLAVLIGVPLGLASGYLGGRVDEGLMRLTDLFLSFPPLLLAMVIAALLGPSLVHAVLALAVSWWPWYARLARTVAQSLRHAPFVDAARVFGVRAPVIVARHVLRNALTPILVQATVDAGTVILAVGSLSFLGLGSQPPLPDWGLMVADGRTTVLTEWWIATFPGLAIFVVALGFNLLGDTLRDVLDPRGGS